MATPNRGYNTPANGSNVDTWDQPVNENWNDIDSDVQQALDLINDVDTGVVTLSNGRAVLDTGETGSVHLGVFLDPTGGGANTQDVFVSSRIGTQEFSSGPTVLHTFDDLNDFTGQTGSWSLDSNFVYNGTNSLTTTNDYPYIEDTTDQIQTGDTFSFRVASNISGTANNHIHRFSWGVTDQDNRNELRIAWNFGGVSSYEYSGGASNYIAGTNIGLDQATYENQWIEVECEWVDSTQANFTFRDDAGNQIGTFNPSGYTNGYTNGGVAFNADNDTANNGQLWYDYLIKGSSTTERRSVIEIIEDGSNVGNPDVGYKVVSH